VRLVLVNLLALVVFILALWFSLAFVLGFATNSAATLGFTARLDHESFGLAFLFVLLMAPYACLAVLVYLVAFRARPPAIGVLAVVVVMLSVAGWLPLPSWLGGAGNTNVQGGPGSCGLV